MARLALVSAAAVLLSGVAVAQNNPNQQPTPPEQKSKQDSKLTDQSTPTAGNLLLVPLVGNVPGGVDVTKPKSPVGKDPNAAERGRKYFVGFNCVGCHAANGGGGMGPSLSNNFFKYGDDPSQMYNVIAHGAPEGMPAWGTVLPDSAIWDIIAYIQTISQDPSPSWGTTTNLAERSPSVEQVPAEFGNTTKPWDHTQPFSSGQKPTSHNPTSTGVSAQGAKAE
jgi:cytochrome c oxidase cbb3-type subunit III